MNLVRLSVGRPIGVTMAVLTLVLFGAIALQSLSLDLLPDVELPIAAVITVYPGADPQTVEAVVTNPLEDLISTVPGLVRLRSTSAENVSIITAEFSWNADLNESLKALENNVAIGARLLPLGVEPPVVLPADPSQFPVMMVAVSGPGDAAELTRAVETYVKPRLQQVPGVAAVQVLGGAYEEIVVRYDSEELQNYGITPTLLYQVIAAQNVVVPAGSATDQGVRYNIRVGQELTDLEDLRNQPVAMRQAVPSPVPGLLAIGQAMPVRLRDVAEVTITSQPREGATRVNGQPAVILRILKQSGANSVAVSRSVRTVLSELEQDANLSLAFYPLTDQADLIGASLGDLSTAAVIGAVLAVAVLLFFLRSVGSILVIGVAIPLSIAGALVIMRALGVTLNMMSLGGLALAVGMLVDNSIVVLENIVRHRRLGKGRIEAALSGASEIAGAIVASTLTTVVVFIPIFFVDSLAGILFRDTGIAVASSLIVSIAVALTVVPAAASRWIGRRRAVTLSPAASLPSGESEIPGAVGGANLEAAAARESGHDEAGAPEEPLFHRKLRKAYLRALSAWTDRPAWTLAALALCLGAILFIPGRLETEFLPPTDGSLITVQLRMPPGWSAEETERHAAMIEAAILDLPEVATVATLVGDQGTQDLISRLTSLGPNEAQMIVVLEPKRARQRSAREIAEAIAAIERHPGIEIEIESDRTLAALGDDFYPGLTVEFSGPDLDVLHELAATWSELLASAGGFKHITSSVRQGAPELFFRVTERSFQGVLGGGEPLTAGQVGLALRHHLTGITATYVTLDGRRLPVVLRPSPEETASVDAIRAFRVPGAQLTSSGAQPILDRIAVMTETESHGAIHHRDRVRVAQVRAELDSIGFAEAKAKAEALLSRLELPPGYEARITGIHQVIDDAVAELGWVLLVAVALVYAVMAAQFESLGQPLVIMLTVPLAAAGALVALWASGRALGVPSLIGIVLLAGIAVNNAIVMIDTVNRRRRAGADPREAILQGAVERLRPILMTAITSIFGLLPLALSLGNGSELQAPMAVAVTGGLVSSTVLTLFVIPGILALAARLPRRRRGKTAVVASSLILALALALAPAPKAAAQANPGRWALTAMAGAAWLDGEPHALVGASASLVNRYAQFSLQASGGLGPSSPRVVSLAAGRYFDIPSGIQLSLRSDWWLGHGNQTSAGLAWRTPYGARRIALSYAGGARSFHPWAGLPGARDGWQLESQAHYELNEARALERSLLLHIDREEGFDWLVTSGSTWRVPGLLSFSAHGGLWLRRGSYHPLLKLETTLSLIPEGRFRVAISPVLTEAPRQWPAVRLEYEGPGNLRPARLEWVYAESRLHPRLTVGYTFPSSPFSLQGVWSPSSSLQGMLILEIAL